MSTETRSEKYDWDKHFADFAKRYLDNNFSVVSRDVELPVKKRRDQYVNIDLKQLPGFISDKVFAITAQVEKIYMQEREEVVGMLVRHQLVEVADLSGTVAYNRVLYHERRWSMTMTVGQVIHATNFHDMYKVIDGSVPIFQIKKIDRYKGVVTIGPANQHSE